MIEKFYDKLENDHNLQGYLKKALENPRDEEQKVEIIMSIARLAGIDLTVEEFKAYQRAGIEKITQIGFAK